MDCILYCSWRWWLVRDWDSRFRKLVCIACNSLSFFMYWSRNQLLTEMISQPSFKVCIVPEVGHLAIRLNHQAVCYDECRPIIWEEQCVATAIYLRHARKNKYKNSHIHKCLSYEQDQWLTWICPPSIFIQNVPQASDPIRTRNYDLGCYFKLLCHTFNLIVVAYGTLSPSPKSPTIRCITDICVDDHDNNEG